MRVGWDETMHSRSPARFRTTSQAVSAPQHQDPEAEVD